MKGEVIKEISAGRKGKPWLACSFIFVLLLVSLVGAAAWGVAATGLIEVPGVSPLAYREPRPERIVEPGVPVERLVDEQVKATLAKRLQDGGGQLKDRSIELRLTERSLTASLRSLLEENQDANIDTSRVQVSVDPEIGFTFFLPIKGTTRETALQISVLPTLTDGVLELHPQGFRVGTLPVPNGLTAFFLRPFIHDKMTALNDMLGSFVEVERIEFGEGEATVYGHLAVEIREVTP